MDISNIFDSVRRNLRQVGNSGNFSEAALVTHLNDILLEVSDELQGIRKSIEIAPDADGKAYVPDDLLTIELVVVNGIELEPLSPRNSELYSRTQVVSAYGYLMVDNYLQVKPTSSGDIQLIYIARPAAIDNEDQQIVLNEAYRMPLVYGILARCFVEIDELDKAQYWESKFIGEMDKRKKQLRRMAFKKKRSPLMPNPSQC